MGGVKHPLSTTEVLKFSNLLEQVFEFISRLRKSNQLAQKIQYPKIPPILSESIGVSIAKKWFGSKSNPRSGGKKADLLVNLRGREKKVEVKATGRRAFQYFGKKDITADFLIWITFKDYFEGRRPPIKVYILENPRKLFKKPLKITIKKFIGVAKDKLVIYESKTLKELANGNMKKIG